MAEPDHHRRAGGGGFIAAFQRFAGFDQREGARRLDTKRLEHFGGEDLAHAALQRQAAIAETAPRRLAAALGGEVHQPVATIAQLREQETAPVADIGIVHAELMAVIAQRERLIEAAPKRLEPAEMRQPVGIAQAIQPNLRRRAVVAETQPRLREVGGHDGIVERLTQFQDRAFGSICLRGCCHAAIWWFRTAGRNHDRL